GSAWRYGAGGCSARGDFQEVPRAGGDRGHAFADPRSHGGDRGGHGSAYHGAASDPALSPGAAGAEQGRGDAGDSCGRERGGSCGADDCAVGRGSEGLHGAGCDEGPRPGHDRPARRPLGRRFRPDQERSPGDGNADRRWAVKRRDFLRNMAGATLAAALPVEVVVERLAAPTPGAKAVPTSTATTWMLDDRIRETYLTGMVESLNQPHPLFDMLRQQEPIASHRD